MLAHTVYTIIDLASYPEQMEIAATWFHQKWITVPKEAYLSSMKESFISTTGVPHWYVIQNGKQEIVAGIGIVANDFHKRKDLSPNICALFVEESERKQGLAKKLLHYTCEQLSKSHIPHVYLITDLTDFYEHCGWTFYGMVEEDDGALVRMYYRATS